jgi:phosphatidate phosphatase APP1
VLEGIKVSGWDAEGKSFNQITNEGGYVILNGKPGLWHFRISGEEFVPRTWDAIINSSTIAANRSLTNPYFIEKINLPELVVVYLYVESEAFGPVLAGVRVTGWDSTGKRFNQITNNEGYVVLNGKPGLWNFTISKEEYENNSWEQYIISYKDRKDAYFVKKKEHIAS